MKVITAILLVFLSGSVTWGASAPSDSDQGSEAAKSSFTQQVSPFTGSRQAVRDNLINPIVGGAPLKTMDGSTSVTTTALTTSNTPLIRISVYENLPTGDVQKIVVEQDLTGSGSFNSAAVFPVPSEASGQMISSVCANGYVMCDAGTYVNCRYRQWQADGTGSISSITAGGEINSSGPGGIASLSGCYCFNKGCSHNNNAILNIDSITANVGGGILAAFLEAKTGMVVTGAQSSGTGQITYFGVSAESVPNGAVVTSLTPQQALVMPVTSSADIKQVQAYYQNSTALNSLTDTARKQQTDTPNSVYNSVLQASNNQGGTKFPCTNLVVPTLNLKTLSSTQGAASGSVCADHLVYAVLTQVDPSTFALGLYGTGQNGTTDIGWNCGGPPPFDATLQANALLIDTFKYTQPADTYGFEMKSVSATLNLSAGGCNSGTVTVTWTPTVGLQLPVIVQSSMTCPAGGAQWPNYSGTWSVEYQSQDLSTAMNLGCAQLEQDTKCSVQQENWDNRPVVVNGLSTGFKLGQVCQDISGPIRSVHYCTPPERPWFRQDKVFYCKNNAQPYNFSSAISRNKQVQDSSEMTDDRTATYTDQGVKYTLAMPVRGPEEPCAQVCQTRMPTPESAVTYSGLPASDALTSAGVTNQAWSYFYKDCLAKTDGTWTCPADSAKGEEVVTQCGCSSDIGSVIGALTAAEEAAQDSICSGN